MGASVAVNESTVRNNMLDSAYQSCGSAGAVNAASFSNVNFTVPAWCANVTPPPDCPGLCLNQTSSVTADCYLSNLQKQAAITAQNLSATAKAGLGLAEAVDVQDTENTIKNITSQKCTNSSSANKVDYKNIKLDACTWRVLQGATDNSQCQINAAQDIIAKVSVQAAAEAKGGSIFGDLFGGGMGKIVGIIVVIVIIAIAIGVAIYFFKSLTSGSGQQQTAAALLQGTTPTGVTKINVTKTDLATELGTKKGFFNLFNDMIGGNWMQKAKENKFYSVVIVLIIILLIIVLFNSRKNVEVINPGANNFNQDIMESHQIAGINPAYYVPLSSSDENVVLLPDTVRQPSSENIVYDNYSGQSEQNDLLDNYYKPLLQA